MFDFITAWAQTFYPFISLMFGIIKFGIISFGIITSGSWLVVIAAQMQTMGTRHLHEILSERMTISGSMQVSRPLWD